MDPRYPIGKFEMPTKVTPARRQQAIEAIAATPLALQTAVKGLTDAQLDTPYRPGGWTVRQVIHHVPDSHMNAYIRLRLALTEDQPTIKTYQEARWAELSDAKSGPIEVSEKLLEWLHERWNRLWCALKPEDFARKFIHPEQGLCNVDWMLFLYEWHGKHHTGHITTLRQQKGW